MPQAPTRAADVDINLLRSGIFLMALRAVADADAAEEIAQETLSRAIAVIREPGATANLGGYVAGIARHVIADHFRATARTTPLTTDAFEAVRDERADALSDLCSDEEAARVRRALGDLTPGDRDLLTLCFFDDLSPADVAVRLGMPPERIRQRKLRALQRLRAAFDALHAVRHVSAIPPTDRTGIDGTEVRGSAA
jgi:RNA polymerase sigma factor (sigma-70 family)